jgi:hypothetical protein
LRESTASGTKNISGSRSQDVGRCGKPAAFGLYADSNTLDLALHVLDELVHHAAEVGVLRDLWAAGLR